MPPEELYTVKEAAKILRLNPATIYALCDARKLKHQRVGLGRGKILLAASALAEYLALGTVRSIETHPAAFLVSAAKR